jgi:uncharacterized OsmC-like protein
MITEQQTTINGVDVGQLKETVEAVRQNSRLAKFIFRVRNQWLGRGRNRSQIKDFYGVGREDTSRTSPYVVENDDPEVLLGEDQAPSPGEYALHSLAGCLTTTLAVHAAARGIEIESMESSVEGDVDIQGFLGLSDQVPRGFKSIRVKMRVKSDASEEELAELAKYSPMYNTLINPVPVEVTIEKV